MSIGNTFVAICGTVGGLSTALGSGYLVAGSIRKRRIGRAETAAQERQAVVDDEQDWIAWRAKVTDTLDGQSPTELRPGFFGLRERMDRAEDKVFGNHNNTIAPIGRGE